MIRTMRIEVDTEGVNGSASGSGESPSTNGELLMVHFDYTGQPATVDVVLKGKAPEQILCQKDSANTDAFFFPRAAAQTNLGAAMTYDGTNAIALPYPFDGLLTLAVAQGDDGGTVVATVYYRQ